MRIEPTTGHKHIRPKCFIIASIIEPDELYTDEEIKIKFLRRITTCYKWSNVKNDFIEKVYK